MRIISVTFLILAAAATVKGAIIELVEIGNPGNAPDIIAPTFEPRGAVGYTYQIGKYEVTAGQYTEFLNAVAKDDPNSLYHPYMADPVTFEVFGCNIQQSGSAGNYSYSVAPEWADRPVNYVSFWDAVRFVNWLSNGQPTGPQGPGTTEDGAYHDIDNQALFGRNSGAHWLIPSQDEWYKAAFHKNDGVTGNYWTYATESDTVPSNTLPDLGNNANYRDDPSLALTIGAPYWRDGSRHIRVIWKSLWDVRPKWQSLRMERHGRTTKYTRRGWGLVGLHSKPIAVLLHDERQLSGGRGFGDRISRSILDCS